MGSVGHISRNVLLAAQQPFRGGGSFPYRLNTGGSSVLCNTQPLRSRRACVRVYSAFMQMPA